MEKSINALLESNLRVIIPDFGAFIIRQKEPKIIVFNEFLRYNDGLLIEHIIKTEGVEIEIARQQLADYAEYGSKELDAGNVFTIAGLGTLQKDKSGKIVFTAESDVKLLKTPQKVKEEPVIQLVEEKPAAEPKVSPKPKRATKSIAKGKPKVPAPKIIKTAGKTKVITKAEVPDVTTPAVEMASSEVIPVVINEQEIVVSTQEPTEIIAGVIEPSAMLVKPAGNSANQVLRWIIFILVANVAILAWFLFQDNIRNLFKHKKEHYRITETVFQNLSDSVWKAATDTSLIFKNTTETATVDKIAPGQGNLRYYIVAGCFRDEINADELVLSLKKKGFKAEKFGKIGNLHAVCFASYDDKELAVKELERIRKEIHPEAWMTRF